jgi:hypothetical protein
MKAGCWKRPLMRSKLRFAASAYGREEKFSAERF